MATTAASGQSSPPPLQPPVVNRSAVTWRSIALGLLGTVLICGVTPYNDYALNNTFVVGNNLPLGAIMLAFVVALLVNAPLSHFAPSHALSSGELTIAFSMTLASCCLPSSGLMRYLPSALVSPFWLSQSNAEYFSLLDGLGLPHWLFPAFAGDGPAEWRNDPLVNGFLGRWIDGPIPYAAWTVPILTWGIFLFALYGALLCMVALVRRQWFENERLAFPLAQIQISLVQSPVPGRFFNDILGCRTFWVGFAIIFLVQIWNGSANYLPKYIPAIPVTYNLASLFAEPPLSYVDNQVKSATLYFTVVGVTCFLPTAIAFSLWFIYILQQVVQMSLGSTTGEAAIHGLSDQHFGAIFAFAAAILFTGRAHWVFILKQAFRGARAGEPRGRYLPYPLAFWGMLACTAIMVGWLLAAGVTFVGAVVTIGLLLLLFMVSTRIIAEAGLVHGMLVAHLWKPWELFGVYGATVVPMKTFYMSGMIDAAHFDFREVMPVYASHGMKLADQTIYASDDEQRPGARSNGWKFLAALALALVVGYFVSFYSTLWTDYTYASTQDMAGVSPVNPWGSDTSKRSWLMEPAVRYQTSNYHPVNEPLTSIGIGATVTAILAFLRLRFAWWPLHPIGYLMLGTFPTITLWFSIMVGWAIKVLILRFGGAKLYTDAKPFLIGVIVGESVAAGFWLIMGIALSTAGLPYHPIRVMPG